MGQSRKTACISTYASYKYIILINVFFSSPFGDLITPFRVRISSQARPETIGHFFEFQMLRQ